MKPWDKIPWSSFIECWILSQLFYSFTFINRLFSSSSFSGIRMVSSAYLKLLIFLPAILIQASASSSPGFCMMYTAYKLNKQGDNMHPWHTPFPIWNRSVVLCLVLTVASWPVYRFSQETNKAVKASKVQGKREGLVISRRNYIAYEGSVIKPQVSFSFQNWCAIKRQSFLWINETTKAFKIKVTGDTHFPFICINFLKRSMLMRIP